MNKNLRRIILAVSAMSLTLMMGCSSSEPTNEPLDPPKELPIATIEIKDYGTIEAELYPHLAPNTVNNFIELSNNNFYNGLIIHRVVKDFVLQGGDPEGTGMGGPGYSISGEFEENGFRNDIKHEAGVLSMARSQHPDSAGSQFFIVTKDSLNLDKNYATKAELAITNGNVATNTAAIETLNGDVNTAGSVAKAIADALTWADFD